MGTDIHFYVERKIENKWVSVDTWKIDEDGNKHVPYKKSFYSGRNYNLFAILADVRNGRGFAGSDTGDGFKIISEPRGIPDDCCDEYRDIVKRIDSDGHSHSYFTLGELLGFDWTQKTTLRGWVDPIDWARWRDHGEPHNFSSFVTGFAVKYFSNEEFENTWIKLRNERNYPEQRWASAHIRNINGGNPDLDRFNEIIDCCHAYTQVSWEVMYCDETCDFWGKTIPRLLALGEPDEVRIVFFFDN